MDKKKCRTFFQKKGLLLTLMLAFFACSVIFPATADAAIITVGRDRRLNQEVTLPITVSGFPNNMAALRLNIKVNSSDPTKQVTITDLSIGKDFPSGATWHKQIADDKKEANVGVINCANLKDGQLFNITVEHTAEEKTVPVTLDFHVTVEEAATVAGDDVTGSILVEDANMSYADIGNKPYYGIITVHRAYGDINGDDKVDISDVMYVLRAAVGKFSIVDDFVLAAGKVSGSAGSILTAYDAFLIAEFVAGNRTFFPVDPPPNAGQPPVPVAPGGKPETPALIEVEGVDITPAGITEVSILDSSEVDVKITFAETFTGWVKLVIKDHLGETESFGAFVASEDEYTFIDLDLQGLGLDLSTDVTVTASLIADEESDKLIANFKNQ